MIDVSVIMPIYNVEDYLEKAILRVLQQTHKNIELILVNDGSPDMSAEICDRYKKQDNRVVVIHQQNAGSGYARNAGLRQARGEYIYFADPDDYIETDLIEENLKIAKETEANLVVFGFFQETINKEGKVSRIEKLPKQKGVQIKKDFRDSFEEFYAFSPYALWNKLYKHSYLLQQNCRFTNQKVGQDALFNQVVYRKIDKVEFNDHSYYHYVYREGSAVNRYRSERFELEYNIANRFEHLIHYWEYEKKYRELIHKEYWTSIYLELSNLSFRDCPLSKDEKIKRIANLMDREPINQAVYGLETKKEQNAFVKILIFLLRHKKYLMALNTMNLRVFIGKNYQVTFNRIKTMFN